MATTKGLKDGEYPFPDKDVAKPRIVRTGGGDYPVYQANTASAEDFRSAFQIARKAGKKTFNWQGRSYTTEKK